MGCGCVLCPVSRHASQVRASLLAAALFAVVASPQLFGVMQGLLGGLFRVASASGTPTAAGLALHAAVYGALTFAIMCLAKRRNDRRRWMY